MKKVLSIAGSDCSGGAGIQADLKTFSAHGVFGMSVIVSVVAENTSRVIDIQDITPDMIEKQIDAVFEDIEVDAVKIGIDLLGLQETVEGIIEEWNNMAVEEYSNHVGLLPHALDYLLRLKEHGIKLAVATGLPEKLYIPCLKNNSILELFDALCSTDEVQRGKEYSDVFELAARKLGVAPEHCIVFDDVLPAIKSAKAARMLAGGIYDKYSADQRTEIERIADIYLLDFRQAPIPHKEV